METELEGFILSRHWTDRAAGLQLEIWLSTASGAVRVVIDGETSLFFIEASAVEETRSLLSTLTGWQEKSLPLQSFSGSSVSGIYFDSRKGAFRARELLTGAGIDVFEADINPAERYLMERFVRGSMRVRGDLRQLNHYSEIHNPRIAASTYVPHLRMVSIDIETAIDRLELFSIGLYYRVDGEPVELVFLVADGDAWADKLPASAVACANERAVLQQFLAWLVDYDPDVLIGWNVVGFDMWYLQRIAERYRLPLQLGRDARDAIWRTFDDEGERRQLVVPGRVVLDGIELLRTATYRFESFSLENVATEVLGSGKLLKGSDRGQQIGELFEHDKAAFVAYNLRDCELVWDIFEKRGLLDFAIARCHMTGLGMSRMGGSVACFDNLYLPRLHRRGFVAPNASAKNPNSPGGFVMNSRPGIYRHVLVLDFKSLYPSIIRTFGIDPLGLALVDSGLTSEGECIAGFDGASFPRTGAILPEIIEELWTQRDRVRRSDDQASSQAIKIIMNSFYGVLGTPGCRFFDTRLASSITRRGHEILLKTREQIEARGLSVIYGDTDSVFVWVEEAEDDATAIATGTALAAELNDWWQTELQDSFGIDSVLELEFETHYQRFLMPTVRGSEEGSKKRYAGVIERNGQQELVFKGLENVRTDWTMLAREYQMELYRRVFFDEPYADYVKSVAASLRAGKVDEKLIYRKRLRRKLDDYQRNLPPHVQAARLARDRGLAVPRRGDWVSYVITSAGAEPAEQPLAALDYQHYIDAQLTPVTDGILHFLDTSFADIAGQQIRLL